MNETFSEHSPTPLITKYITQSRRILQYTFTIIKARISASPQNTGNSIVMTTQSTGCTK